MKGKFKKAAKVISDTNEVFCCGALREAGGEDKFDVFEFYFKPDSRKAYDLWIMEHHHDDWTEMDCNWKEIRILALLFMHEMERTGDL